MKDNVFEHRTKIIGARVTPEEHKHLGLLAVYNHTTRSNLATGLMRSWLKSSPPIEDLLYKLAERAFQRWEQDRKTSETFPDYLRKVEIVLRRKRVYDLGIKHILKIMSEMYQSKSKYREII
jgi:hypothetical protein